MDKDALEIIKGVFYMGTVALFTWGVFGLIASAL